MISVIYMSIFKVVFPLKFTTLHIQTLKLLYFL